ncbi:Response regulator receiver domain-containing protein [Desulfacinum hydrothermale DSM 13146]|uniref:Response regulator receiver domain-containing protein n=1 Tax=Desulfacinum hydrothermale DSM 13146 TaxID=1121390 RepID=A0A1W1WYS0_9BACT|nr:response regulator [Desulfacinum hydrothermale]SMC16271.1 Response regulator receiver domain-containing protein [Desulfacinum hydrothermale DSM 13146]
MDAGNEARKAATPDPRPPLDRCRVLLVDDEPSLLEIGCQLLSLEGIQTFTAANGEEALEILHSMEPLPHGVILDLNMPGMGGIQCLQKMRATWPDLPVIVSTGYLDGEERSRLLDLGAFDVVEKPYRLQSMVNILRRALPGKPGT